MRLDKGKSAGSKKGMRHNIEVMLEDGYKPKRARGAAYGEVGLEKRGREDERRAMLKKAMKSDKQHSSLESLHKTIKKC